MPSSVSHWRTPARTRGTSPRPRLRRARPAPRMRGRLRPPGCGFRDGFWTRGASGQPATGQPMTSRPRVRGATSKASGRSPSRSRLPPRIRVRRSSPPHGPNRPARGPDPQIPRPASPSEVGQKASGALLPLGRKACLSTSGPSRRPQWRARLPGGGGRRAARTKAVMLRRAWESGRVVMGAWPRMSGGRAWNVPDQWDKLNIAGVCPKNQRGGTTFSPSRPVCTVPLGRAAGTVPPSAGGRPGSPRAWRRRGTQQKAQ
jgi:hypothetical protein